MIEKHKSVDTDNLQVKRHPRPEPFIKWAGGKSQLLKYFIDLYPANFNTYYEPFLGGGAVFFHLYALKKIHDAVLSDMNPELMNLWAAIKRSDEELIKELESLQPDTTKSTCYYEKRREYNELKLMPNFLEEPDFHKAALLIYLNKTCYNGLYRVNAKGQFNVPFGKYKNPQIINRANLSAVHRALNEEDRIKLFCEDFRMTAKGAKKGDFVYFDPPYEPLDKTSSFTEYTSGGFGRKDQIALSKLFQRLDNKGCRLMLSNSNKKEVLKPLYENYLSKRHLFLEVPASRAISCKGSKRGPVTELIIMNYPRPSLFIDE